MTWCNVDIICCNMYGPSATGKDNKEFNFRHDWNSLISDDPTLRMTSYTEKYFPDADTIVSVLRKFIHRSWCKNIFMGCTNHENRKNTKCILQRIIIIARKFLLAQFHSTASYLFRARQSLWYQHVTQAHCKRVTVVSDTSSVFTATVRAYGVIRFPLHASSLQTAAW